MEMKVVTEKPIKTKVGRGRSRGEFSQAIYKLEPGETLVVDVSELVTEHRKMRVVLAVYSTVARQFGLGHGIRLDVWQNMPNVYVYRKLDTDE